MARPRQFDYDDVLMKALNAFWVRGYDATTVRNLTDCMGINRATLYSTFGDKRSLFITALRRYDAVYREQWAAEIAKSRSPRQAILDVFEAAIAVVVEDGVRDGCLLINTALELSPHDREIAEIVAHAFAAMEEFFRVKIEQGQAGGEISGALAPVDTARSLLSLFIGLRVLARSRPEEPLLRSIADHAGISGARIERPPPIPAHWPRLKEAGLRRPPGRPGRSAARRAAITVPGDRRHCACTRPRSA